MKSSLQNPRVTDNDRGEITVSLDGKELRGWSYSSDNERRLKMLCAQEFVEGLYVRSDIAERMAEALETHQLWEKREKEGPLYPWGMKRDDPGGEKIWSAWWNDQLSLCSKAWELTDAALSAFRSATQDTEASHD